MGQILVINAGSSSIKFALFDDALVQTLSGNLAEIGGESRLGIMNDISDVTAADHATALGLILDALEKRGVTPRQLVAAGHRVVHGGRDLIAPSRVTPTIKAAIAACARLAPLHNPHNLAAIRALEAIAPSLPQVACFDTAFHATNPEVARRYAIPAVEDAKGIRRYGFHGLSFASLIARLPGLSGAPLPRRLLALHLGNGASLCAILAGQSVATTMGFSPLDGLTMGTRAGAIDGNAVLRLATDHGIDGASRILNRESGLLALGGASDMGRLSRSRAPEARFAVQHFCYWAVRHAGSMIAAMGGVDAIAFTGGIGENAPDIRAAIMDGLGWAGVTADAASNRLGAARLHTNGSGVAAWIVPATEERQIAAETQSCLGSRR